MDTPADSERLLKAGVTAYKAGEYERAITSLQPLLRNRAYRLKAGIGLVRVYVSQGNWCEAEKLCQKIGQSSQPSVQQWSQETLAKIEQRMAKASAVLPARDPARPATGFAPLSPAVTTPAVTTPAVKASLSAIPEISIPPVSKTAIAAKATVTHLKIFWHKSRVCSA